MPSDIYVAILHIDTRAGDTLDCQEKTVKLRDHIKLAETHFKTLGWKKQSFKLFVAPEYYFADFSSGKDQIKGYDTADKQAVLTLLQGISQDFADTLILGGTIAWKMQLGRGARDAINQQLKAAQAQMLHLQQGTKLLWYNEVELARQNIRLKGSNIAGKLSRTPKLRWFGYNAAFACFNGALLGEIQKSTNAMEFSGENPADDVVMIPGTSSGTFTVPGFKGLDDITELKVGVEICGDHGRIGQFKEEVDIHVLLAASQRAGSTYAHVGGIFIHCDSHVAPQVYRSIPLGTLVQDRKAITDKDNTVKDSANHLYVQKVTLGAAKAAAAN